MATVKYSGQLGSWFHFCIPFNVHFSSMHFGHCAFWYLKSPRPHPWCRPLFIELWSACCVDLLNLSFYNRDLITAATDQQWNGSHKVYNNRASKSPLFCPWKNSQSNIHSGYKQKIIFHQWHKFYNNRALLSAPLSCKMRLWIFF